MKTLLMVPSMLICLFCGFLNYTVLTSINMSPSLEFMCASIMTLSLIGVVGNVILAIELLSE
jgi:hypothetical protein